MNKSLSERIAEKQAQKTQRKTSVGKTQFIAHMNDIKTALDDGWPMKAIWETLYDEGKVSFTYKSFRHYVSQLIRTKQDDTRDDNSKESKSKSPSEIKGFTFNPKPDLEKLL